MREKRELWDNAPTRSELNGANIRLPGYVVPLEQSRGEVKEFLLVPYFGVCIHSPPPPANQIVHVVLSTPNLCEPWKRSGQAEHSGPSDRTPRGE